MNWLLEIEQTVTGLGYALVDAERGASGLLQVFIEHPEGVTAITVDDCERVTKQLQFVLEVAGLDYQRLEVSSAGLDRPLKKKEDFDRFVGSTIEVVFKLPVEMNVGEKPYQQKKFIGRLEAAEGEDHDWMLVLGEEQDANKKRVSKKKAEQERAVMALGFKFAEVRDAKLVPVVNFKSKKKNDVAADAESDAATDESLNNNGDLDR
ncbi:MAG: ribosome maturation factor RimP [Saezia sp.]